MMRCATPPGRSPRSRHYAPLWTTSTTCHRPTAPSRSTISLYGNSSPPRYHHHYHQTSPSYATARLLQHVRTLHSTTPRPLQLSQPGSQLPPSSKQEAKNDTWSPIRYLQFASQRARPIHDLIAQLKPHVLARNPHPRILDLGCGPGNSTRALLEAFPAAKKITGVDSSPEMLATARRAGIGRGGGVGGGGGGGGDDDVVEFVEGDMAGFSLSNEHGDADRGVDLLFSNAALHWLRTPTLQHNLSTWFAALRPGAVLAFQVPDTVRQPTHVLMRQVACVKDQSWSRYFEDCSVGDVSDASRPDLDPFPQPARLIELFRRNGAGAAADVDIWHTEYSHVLPSASSIVEWVSGTGLRPFLERIADPGAREAFLERYERDITRVYGDGGLEGGGVVLGYRRLFVVAVKG